MTSVLLVVTHVAAFLAGVLAVRAVVKRYLRPCPCLEPSAIALNKESAHMPFSKENRHLTVSLVAIIASLFVVAIGVQAYLAARDNAERDRRDAAYADCLTRFAADLVDNISTVRQASVALEDARDRKDQALDMLLRVTERARHDPPLATGQEFDAALAARVRAQDAYDAAKAALGKVRDNNRLVKPQVACSR